LENFRFILQNYRFTKKLTQKELSHRLGVSEITISQIERGNKKLNKKQILKIMKILKLSFNKKI
jgi:transcriptional regulator with XRE-family HTH domain